MFRQSKPYPEIIELVAQLKARHGLKIAVVSNEGRELNAYRIGEFKLDGFVDSFISSCFVHLRKPDADIFRLALEIATALEKASVGITDVLALLGNDRPHRTPRNKVADWLLEMPMHDLG